MASTGMHIIYLLLTCFLKISENLTATQRAFYAYFKLYGNIATAPDRLFNL